MAKMIYQNEKDRVEVEVNDLHAVIIVLGLVAAAIAGVYIVTRNPELLRELAAIARDKGVALIENSKEVKI